MADANEARQTEEELRVFESFVEITAVRVIRGSIEKRPTPEPDISCEIESEGRRAFELGEVVDERVRRSLSDGPELGKLMFEAWQLLDDGSRNRTKSMDVLLEFGKDVSLRKRRLTIPEVWELLSTLPTGFAGTIGLTPGLQRLVRRLEVDRTTLIAPLIHVSNSTNFGDPVLRMAEEKLLGKTYRSPCPAELILWYEVQPMDDAYVGQWPADMDDRVRTLLTRSIFRSVWILDLNGRRILRHIERSSPCANDPVAIP